MAGVKEPTRAGWSVHKPTTCHSDPSTLVPRSWEAAFLQLAWALRRGLRTEEKPGQRRLEGPGAHRCF